MQWWPPRFTSNGPQASQAPQVPATLPSTRPVTGLEFVSDLASDSRKARTFVFLVGSLLVIAAVCIAGVCFAIMAAAREVEGVPVLTTVSVGAGGASLLTVLGAVVKRWIKERPKSAKRTGSSEPPNGASP